MKVETLQNKLISAARRHPPNQQVPYAFEKRIITRLTNLSSIDYWGSLASTFWRAASLSLLVMALLGAWSFWVEMNGSVGSITEDLEETVLAAIPSIPSSGDSW